MQGRACGIRREISPGEVDSADSRLLRGVLRTDRRAALSSVISSKATRKPRKNAPAKQPKKMPSRLEPRFTALVRGLPRFLCKRRRAESGIPSSEEMYWGTLHAENAAKWGLHFKPESSAAGVALAAVCGFGKLENLLHDGEVGICRGIMGTGRLILFRRIMDLSL